MQEKASQSLSTKPRFVDPFKSRIFRTHVHGHRHSIRMYDRGCLPCSDTSRHKYCSVFVIYLKRFVLIGLYF